MSDSKRVSICAYRMEFLAKLAATHDEPIHVVLGRVIDNARWLESQGLTCTGLPPMSAITRESQVEERACETCRWFRPILVDAPCMKCSGFSEWRAQLPPATP